jgi:DNA gyrase/topoisomerase IV subunit A
MNEITKHSPKYSGIKEYFEDFLSEQEDRYVNLITFRHDEEEERHEILSEFFQGAFNTDEYIIGTHRCEEWCGSDTWRSSKLYQNTRKIISEKLPLH